MLFLSYMGGAHAWFAEAARQQTIESLAQRMDPIVLDQADRLDQEVISHRLSHPTAPPLPVGPAP